MRISWDIYDLFTLIRVILLSATIVLLFIGRDSIFNRQEYLGKLVFETKVKDYFDKENHEIKDIYIVTYQDDNGKTIVKTFNDNDDYTIKHTSNMGNVIYLNNKISNIYVIISFFTGLLWLFFLIFHLAIISDDEDDEHYGNPFKPILALLFLPFKYCEKHKIKNRL